MNVPVINTARGAQWAILRAGLWTASDPEDVVTR